MANLRLTVVERLEDTDASLTPAALARCVGKWLPLRLGEDRYSAFVVTADVIDEGRAVLLTLELPVGLPVRWWLQP